MGTNYRFKDYSKRVRLLYFSLAVSFKSFLISEILCRGNNSGNNTCFLWERSTSENLVFDLSETYHRSFLFGYFYSERHI